MKNIKHYKSIVVSLAIVAGLLLFGQAFAAGAPSVTTVAVSPSDVSSTSAIIKATVFPNGADSQVWFKYSTNATLAGATQPSCFPTVLGSVTNQTVPCTISGLIPNTTYYFRAYASNQHGPANQAQIYTFTTTSGGGSGTGNGTCAINAFNVPTSASLGQSVTISWDTSNCTTVTLSGGGLSNSPQNVDGQVTVIPSANGTYTFTLKANGTVTATRTLTVGSGNTGTTGGGTCVIYNFKLNGTNNSTTLTYQPGMQVLVSWQTTSGCTGVTISGGGLPSTNHGATGQFYIAPSAPGTYTFTLTATGGSNPTATRVLTLTSGGSGTGTTGGTGGGNCHIDSFTSYSSQINSGSSTVLGWGTSNCSQVSISGIGSVSADGTTSTGALYGTTTFVLTASGLGGTVSSQVTVGIISQTQHCDITNFFASSQNIMAGDGVTLTWNSTNCSTVSISGGSINGSYGANSSLTVYPTQTTSYTITGYGTGGWNDTANVTVTVNQNQQNNYCQINYFNTASNTVSYGGTTQLSWGTSNCTNVTVFGPGVSSSNQNGSITTAPIYTTGIYTITAYGTSNGNQTQSVYVSANGNQQFPQNQSCLITDFSASPSSVLRGGNTTLSWNTTGNCASAILTNMSGYSSNVSVNGSSNSGTMNVLGTRIFTLKVYAANGSGLSDTRTVSVLVYQNGVAPSIYACSDGYDNDGDGRIDGNDPGCTSSTDNSEFNTTVVNTGTTGSAVNGITVTTNSADGYNTYSNRSNLGGLALFSGVTLPGTLVGWLVLLIIIALVVLLLRSIIGYAPLHGNHGHRPTSTDGHH